MRCSKEQLLKAYIYCDSGLVPVRREKTWKRYLCNGLQRRQLKKLYFASELLCVQMIPESVDLDVAIDRLYSKFHGQFCAKQELFDLLLTYLSSSFLYTKIDAVLVCAIEYPGGAWQPYRMININYTAENLLFFVNLKCEGLSVSGCTCMFNLADLFYLNTLILYKPKHSRAANNFSCVVYFL